MVENQDHRTTDGNKECFALDLARKHIICWKTTYAEIFRAYARRVIERLGLF
jgi:hypothetical protein